MGFARADNQARILVIGDTVRRDGIHQPDAGTDDGMRPDDGVASENGGVRIYRDTITDLRMAFDALDGNTGRIGFKGLRTERDALVNFHVLADDRGFTNHDTRTVIDEKIGTDMGSRVDIDACAFMPVFGEHTG